jgi:hypothetical protein
LIVIGVFPIILRRNDYFIALQDRLGIVLFSIWQAGQILRVPTIALGLLRGHLGGWGK